MLRLFQSRVTRTFFLASLGIAACAAADAGVRPKLRPTLPADVEPILVSLSPDLSSRTPAYTPRAVDELPPAPPARYFTINEVLATRKGALPAARLAAVDPAALATDAPASGTVAVHQPDEPFGYAMFRAPDGLLWAKWRKVQGDIASEAAATRQCADEPETCTSPAARKFATLVKNARKHEGRDQIDFVNRTINGDIKYASDMSQHGVPDLWSAPLATYASGRGDCEDYAIAKYVALREAGRSSDDLRLLLVHDNAARMDHAVLAVRNDGRWLVLDNRHAILMEQRDLRFFTPLFALDQSGVRFFAAPYTDAKGATSAQEPMSVENEEEFSLRGTIAEAVPTISSRMFEAPLLI